MGGVTSPGTQHTLHASQLCRDAELPQSQSTGILLSVLADALSQRQAIQHLQSLDRGHLGALTQQVESDALLEEGEGDSLASLHEAKWTSYSPRVPQAGPSVSGDHWSSPTDKTASGAGHDDIISPCLGNMAFPHWHWPGELLMMCCQLPCVCKLLAVPWSLHSVV